MKPGEQTDPQGTAPVDSEGVNPAREGLLAGPASEFTDGQLGFLSFEHVHCSILTLRRCLQGVSWTDPVTSERRRLERCERPAVMSVPSGPGGDIYACDACSELFGNVALEDGGEELPQAAVVRRYNRLSCTRAAPINGVYVEADVTIYDRWRLGGVFDIFSPRTT